MRRKFLTRRPAVTATILMREAQVQRKAAFDSEAKRLPWTFVALASKSVVGGACVLRPGAEQALAGSSPDETGAAEASAAVAATSAARPQTAAVVASLTAGAGSSPLSRGLKRHGAPGAAAASASTGAAPVSADAPGSHTAAEECCSRAAHARYLVDLRQTRTGRRRACTRARSEQGTGPPIGIEDVTRAAAALKGSIIETDCRPQPHVLGDVRLRGVAEVRKPAVHGLVQGRAAR